jgi:hypothetical protein
MACLAVHGLSRRCSDCGVDRARLPKLVGLWVEAWQQIQKSVCRAPGLRHLGVYGYGGTNLLALADNAALQSITLQQAPRLERLLGIESMKRSNTLSSYASELELTPSNR